MGKYYSDIDTNKIIEENQKKLDNIIMKYAFISTLISLFIAFMTKFYTIFSINMIGLFFLIIIMPESQIIFQISALCLFAINIYLYVYIISLTMNP